MRNTSLCGSSFANSVHVSPCCAQDILIGAAKFVDNHTVKYGLPGRVDVGGQVTAKDIIIATGSVPFVPPGRPEARQSLLIPWNEGVHVLNTAPEVVQQAQPTQKRRLLTTSALQAALTALTVVCSTCF